MIRAATTAPRASTALSANTLLPATSQLFIRLPVSKDVKALGVLLASLILAGGAAPAQAAPGRGAQTPSGAVERGGLARTPPMGFDGWNAFHCQVSAAMIRATAEAMVQDGMNAAGYTQVDVDDCWMAAKRAHNGRLRADPAKFPHGIKAVADYVHSLGLKLGLYEDAGVRTCAGYPGSYGHYAQDAATFASWGVDYLKFDGCHIPFGHHPGRTRDQVVQHLYAEMSADLRATGRPIVFAVSTGYDPSVHAARWAPAIANLWRTSVDIEDTFSSMLHNFTSTVGLYDRARPGAWNDPDMLEIGNGGLSAIEEQTQFSLWAEMAAPLIAGTNLVSATDSTLSTYENPAVIAVDQDSLGVQGRPVYERDGHWLLTKRLADGDRAVVLFNQQATAGRIVATLTQVGFPGSSLPELAGASFELTDLWTGRTSFTNHLISAMVPGHGVVMYRIHPETAPVGSTAPAR